MKRYLYSLIVLFAFIGCSTDEVEVYQSEGYISFVEKESDTLVVSFFLLGNLQEYDLPVSVRFTGDPYREKQPISLVVNEKKTTMAAQYYDLPQPEMSAMSHLDTFKIHLKNYPELQTRTDMLCIELKENDAFQLGDRNYRRMYIKINDNVAKPDWWSRNTERYYLGAYSDEKIRELMIAAQPDLTGKVDEGMIRTWALKLKYHLEKRADSPEGPVTEKDGSLMTVPVKG
ncbi:MULTISPECIES: DUF4843 domain-containing protein [Gabonibacter]|uniref:DUF4843 domain-containing protein n=1 Tax=Gabonibacter TaxID=1911312 RepID=UPI00073EE4A3|nr:MULTISPECIES: DUF4843 domain-containing protein [Gabonibacter]MCR9013213.1 DUF4843 domain-containing protein [Gabonibacter chumensis]